MSDSTTTQPLLSITDLLSPDEQQQLRDDLAAMVKLRRQAEAESAHIVIGGGDA